jgi:hypothetical protein
MGSQGAPKRAPAISDLENGQLPGFREIEKPSGRHAGEGSYGSHALQKVIRQITNHFALLRVKVSFPFALRVYRPVDKGYGYLYPLMMEIGAMIPTITVSEIAGRIWRPGDNMTEAQLVERIRAWTKEGLLMPAGEKNPGTGRHRRYPYSAVPEAMLLKVLSEAIGRMQGIKARAFGEFLQAAKEELANNPPGGKLLIVAIAPEGGAIEINLIQSGELLKVLAGSRYEAHFVIDLGKLFR